MESSQPTGRLPSEPPTRPVSGGEASAPTRPLPPGGGSDGGLAAPGALVLGRYRLEQRLGAGGFGVVWRARDEHLEREVAVKAIARPETGSGAEVADRPEREARAAARLNHPGIVALYEMGADAASVYLVSELVQGRTFAELTRAVALSDRDIGRIGVALAEALAHAHARGVIHRDVKPQNVIVLAEPAAGAGFAKLADFGVAHLVGDEPLTRTGDIVGTLAYMAPEQAEGLVPTGACDVYSLALTLYEGLAGENPVRGRSPAETARLVGQQVPALRELRRDLPVSLCRGIDACLEPRPEHRPQLAELRDWIDETVDRLESRGGLVESATLARVGLPRRGERLEAPARPREEGRHAPVWQEPEPERRRDERFRDSLEPRWSADSDPAPVGERALWAPAAIVARTGAGVAAGALVLAALAVPAAEAPVAPLPAAGVVALAVALLPRLGWAVGAAGVLAWLALGAGLQGAALVVLVAVGSTPLLVPRAGVAWSLPALAPLLGWIALGPAYLGIAGAASTALRRAGLGAAGYLWLCGAEALVGDPLLYGAPADVSSPGAWAASLPAAATDVIPPYVVTPALVAALAWALFAALVPLAVRGRSLALDLLGGSLWAGGLIATLLALGDLLAAAGGGLATRGAVLGPLVGVALAIGIETLRRGPLRAFSGRGERARGEAMDRRVVA